MESCQLISSALKLLGKAQKVEVDYRQTWHSANGSPIGLQNMYEQNRISVTVEKNLCKVIGLSPLEYSGIIFHLLSNDQ